MLLAVLMTQKYKVMEKKNNNTSGYTDSRGEWRPDNPIVYAPLFVWPPKIRKFLLWLFHYLLPGTCFTWVL
jgi:hypothetical protein